MTVRSAKAQISLAIRSGWSESSLCAQWVTKDPSFLHADSEDWSDWADAQADLSLHWAHMPFCWIFHEAAHLGVNCITHLCLVEILWFKIGWMSVFVSKVPVSKTHKLEHFPNDKQRRPWSDWAFWAYTVCQGPFPVTLGNNGLKAFLCRTPDTQISHCRRSVIK